MYTFYILRTCYLHLRYNKPIVGQQGMGEDSKGQKKLEDSGGQLLPAGLRRAEPRSE